MGSQCQQHRGTLCFLLKIPYKRNREIFQRNREFLEAIRELPLLIREGELPP